ncbi:MAG: sulfatase [Lentisphaeraceae bacterium]|nr:sulfatase [Lentisphaeraceae bacterium]
MKFFLLVILCFSNFLLANEKPNIIIVFTDDQGYADLSCFGGKHVSTPHIDTLASEGVRLTNFYVGSPLCTPSRAALMTGCYPKRIDIGTGSEFAVLLAADKKGLNPEEVTIAEILKEQGYATALIGKWHLGDQPEFLPTRQGFDEYYGIPYSHDIHPYHPKQKKFNFPPLPFLDGEKVIETDPNADLLTTRLTERAVQFIEKNKEKPFFLYLPHPIPHAPLHISPKTMETVSPEIKAGLKKEAKTGKINYNLRRKLFKQAITEIDNSVQTIVDTLKKNYLDDNTILIFTTDNGPAIGKATPLKGKKGSTYEGGQRVPAFVRWPGKIPAGQVSDELLTAMDLLPTLTKLAGGKLPEKTIDGKDVIEVLKGKAKSPHKFFYYYSHTTVHLDAIRSGKWKLRMKDYKPVALYNLTDDIGEKKDVLKANPEVAQRLAKAAQAFDQKISANVRPAAIVENPVALKKN